MTRQQRRRVNQLRRLHAKARQGVCGKSDLHKEYQRVQADLAAYLNIPRGVQVGKNFWGTLNYLERRLDQIETRLLQQSA